MERYKELFASYSSMDYEAIKAAVKENVDQLLNSTVTVALSTVIFTWKFIIKKFSHEE